METKMLTVIVISALAGLAVGFGAPPLVKALKKDDNTAEVVAGVADVVAAGNAPILAELDNVKTAIDETRLDRHCTPPEPGKVDAQYLWCMAADCWDKQAVLNQSGSETCADVRTLAKAATICEMQTDPAVRAICLEKLVPR